MPGEGLRHCAGWGERTPRLKQPVGHGKRVVQDRIGGEVAHGERVDRAQRGGVPRAAGIDVLDGKPPREHGSTVMDGRWRELKVVSG